MSDLITIRELQSISDRLPDPATYDVAYVYRIKLPEQPLELMPLNYFDKRWVYQMRNVELIRRRVNLGGLLYWAWTYGDILVKLEGDKRV